MKPRSPLSIFSLLVLFGILTNFSSCTGYLTSSLIGSSVDNLQQQSDVELVCEGGPSFLLMIDSLIAEDPKDHQLLLLGARSYSGFVGAMLECGVPAPRILAISQKGYTYGQNLLQNRYGIDPNENLANFKEKTDQLKSPDAYDLFWISFSWITWIQQQNGSPAALADISKVEALLLKTVMLDESVENGAAHFLLGAFYGSRPKMLGGEPRKSRYHFEKALELSNRNMLIYQTTYAETLARITMNQQLHDTLLHEVVHFDINTPSKNRLANTIAQRRAARLLDERFFE